MYKLKSESDNTVVEEVNKKLVKEYHDFFVEILQMLEGDHGHGGCRQAGGGGQDEAGQGVQ